MFQRTFVFAFFVLASLALVAPASAQTRKIRVSAELTYDSTTTRFGDYNDYYTSYGYDGYYGYGYDAYCSGYYYDNCRRPEYRPVNQLITIRADPTDFFGFQAHLALGGNSHSGGIKEIQALGIVKWGPLEVIGGYFDSHLTYTFPGNDYATDEVLYINQTDRFKGLVVGGGVHFSHDGGFFETKASWFPGLKRADTGSYAGDAHGYELLASGGVKIAGPLALTASYRFREFTINPTVSEVIPVYAPRAKSHGFTFGIAVWF